MSEPSRLLERGASDLERLLLEAGAREEPGGGGVRKTAAVLGVAAVVSSASPVVAAATVAEKIWWSSWAKWSLLAAAGPGLAVTLALTADRSGTTSQEAPVPSGAESAHVVRARSTARPTPSATEVPSTASAATPVEATSATSRSRRTTGGHGSSLKEEIAILDQVRDELHGGNPAGALRTLDRHAREYPRGVLREEAMLLRIEALAQSGNRAAAERLARRLLSLHPESPHAKRLASLLGPQILEGSSPARDE